jgi:hypothetical protein
MSAPKEAETRTILSPACNQPSARCASFVTYLLCPSPYLGDPYAPPHNTQTPFLSHTLAFGIHVWDLIHAFLTQFEISKTLEAQFPIPSVACSVSCALLVMPFLNIRM